jgi:hypothetical protein
MKWSRRGARLTRDIDVAIDWPIWMRSSRLLVPTAQIGTRRGDMLVDAGSKKAHAFICCS